MKMPKSPFSTRLSGSAKETELRLRSIFQWKKKRPPVVLFVLTALVVLLCFGLFACVPEEAEQENIPVADVTPEETNTPDKASEGETSDTVSGDLLGTLAAITASDFINPEYFGNVTAERLAAALNAAVDHQISEAEFMDAIGGAYGSVFPHWYIENAWLEGGPNAFSSLDRHLSVNCGLPENIVEVTLSEDNHRETAYFEDAALYQMVRHKNDYEEIIDGEAYARFEGELVREMKETLALFASNPGNFTGYELKRFNLAWSYADARTDSQVELYYFDFGLLTDTPETIGWAGGMALDSELRVVGVGSGWFAARCRDGEVVCTSFVGNELYYSPLMNGDEVDWAKELINNALDYAAANPHEQFDFVWVGDPVSFMELTIQLPDSWKGKVGYVRPSPDFIQFYHLPSRQSGVYSGDLFSLGWSLGALPLDYDVGNGQVLASTKNASYILTWPEEPQCPPATYEEYAAMSLNDVQIIPSQKLLDSSENRFS